MKFHIFKVTDRDDHTSDPMYYTLKKLRENAVEVWYDTWDENRDEPQDYTKEQIKENDDDLFSWLSGWGFDVEVIYTITENDLK
jgi:hypothetical protein